MPKSTTRTFLVAAMVTLMTLVATNSRAGQEITAEQRKLAMEGAQLWPIYCAQCHNARPGSEFSPDQWNAITMHMRTQSNMPAKNIRAITEFLKTVR